MAIIRLYVYVFALGMLKFLLLRRIAHNHDLTTADGSQNVKRFLLTDRGYCLVAQMHMDYPNYNSPDRQLTTWRVQRSSTHVWTHFWLITRKHIREGVLVIRALRIKKINKYHQHKYYLISSEITIFAQFCVDTDINKIVYLYYLLAIILYIININ